MPPLLDFAALGARPLKPAVTLPGLEHPAFPAVLTAAMPKVQYSRTFWPDGQDEHSPIDSETGSAVRIVIAWDRHQRRARTCIAEVGDRPLWDELVNYLGQWERNSSTIPTCWQPGGQRAVLPSSQESGAHRGDVRSAGIDELMEVRVLDGKQDRSSGCDETAVMANPHLPEAGLSTQGVRSTGRFAHGMATSGMTMPDQPAEQQTGLHDEAWLVLGPVHLIHGTAGLTADALIALAALPAPRTTSVDNTVVVSFSELGPSSVTTRTMGGERQASETVAELFQDGLPTPGLAQLIAQSTTPSRSTWVPLFYVAAQPDTDGVAVHVYSQIRFPGPDACFLRITSEPLRTGTVESLDWLPTALEYHHQYAQFLNSHERHFQKWRPDQELEYKYTLNTEADIYRLAVDVRRALHDGALPGFMLGYRNEFECWDYLNYLYEVIAPADEGGYVSFIPTSEGTYVQKRKWFVDDATQRREQLSYDVNPGTSFDDHIASHLGLQARALPRFRRVRYDVNLESVRTGACFSIVFDRCTLPDAPQQALVQCELEYTSSRTLFPPAEHDVLSDLETVAGWLESFLGQREPGVQRGAYSKLSFLREVTVSPR